MRIFILFILIVFTSCGVYKGMRKKEFFYDDGDPSAKLNLLVPKGYKRVERKKDADGNIVQTYHYSAATNLYFMYVKGKMPELDTSSHVGRPHIQGGRFYKGMISDHEFWREVVIDKFRFGYRNAEQGKQEARFDSALNYVRVK